MLNSQPTSSQNRRNADRLQIHNFVHLKPHLYTQSDSVHQ